MADRSLPDQDIDRRFEPFAEKMKQHGLAPVVINAFRFYYRLLVRGETGRISETQIKPVTADDIADAERLAGLRASGRHALDKTVVIKLNGGLGTSMGLSRAKSLLEAKARLCFLDIIVRQIISHKNRSGARLPLVFMNSFNTEADTLDALASYRDLPDGHLPLSFVQHKFPKVFQEGLAPATWPANPDLEWNPPGHGDIFLALSTSGMLGRLLGLGIEYAFVSNTDNLGALIDETILGYFAENNFSFMMEVADRTLSDKKGGHLARLRNGRFTLREIAQCPDDELERFQDVHLFRYFNTNNIWVNLPALSALLRTHDNALRLPMIRNPKTIDPRDETSPPVYQLETAIGSAISLFDNAMAVRVPRARFAPVKKCEDLLALWSDAYVLTDDYRVILNPRRKLPPPFVHLDSRFYKKIGQLKARFPQGPPSLLACGSLRVRGDVVFGRGTEIKGDVVIENHSKKQASIADGTIVDKNIIFP